MIQTASLVREEQRRKKAAFARAAIRYHFVGEGAARRRWRFAYDALVYGALAAAGVVCLACVTFGLGIGHDELLAQFHAWMVATPLDQVRLAVGDITAGVVRKAAAAGLLFGPMIAFIRTVPTKPGTVA